MGDEQRKMPGIEEEREEEFEKKKIRTFFIQFRFQCLHGNESVTEIETER